MWENPVCLVMPALSLWLACSASLIRRVQTLVATYVAAPYAYEAELVGLAQRRVLSRRLLPSVTPGVLRLLAQMTPYPLGGAVVVETVTSFPGPGFALVRAVGDREVPVAVTAGALVMAVAVVAFTVADALPVRRERMVAVV